MSNRRFTFFCHVIFALAAVASRDAGAQVRVGAGGSVYLLGPEETWHEAKQSARAPFPGWMLAGVEILPPSDVRGELTAISDAAENASLGDWAGWIGLSDDEDDDELQSLGASEAGNTSGARPPRRGSPPRPGEWGSGFVWSDGSEFTYARWDLNEPNNSFGSEDFIERNEGGFWNDLPATARRRGIREYPLQLEEHPIELVVDVKRDEFGDLRGRIAAAVKATGVDVPAVEYQIHEQLSLPWRAGSNRYLSGMLTEVYFRENQDSANFLKSNRLPRTGGVWTPGEGFAGLIEIPDGPRWAQASEAGAPSYPQSLIDLGFPAEGDQNAYSTRSQGEIFLNAGQEYRFRDGVDDYALLQLDLNRDGDFDDGGETIIDDNSWTNFEGTGHGYGGVAPGDELVVEVEQSAWYPIVFGTAEQSGGDPVRLMWNVDNGLSPDAAATIEGESWWSVDGSVLRYRVPSLEQAVLAPLGGFLDGGAVGFFGTEGLGTVDEAALLVESGGVGGANFNDGRFHHLIIEARIADLSVRQELHLEPHSGCSPLAKQGDVDCDGDVDLADFNILKANFGAVPEPDALALIGIVLASAYSVGRFRRIPAVSTPA